MSYITLDELKKPPFNLSDLDKTEAELLIDLSKDFIDRITRQEFDLEGTISSPVDKIINGNGKRLIALPKRLVELKEVVILVTDVQLDTFPADNFIIHRSRELLEWKELTTVSLPRLRREVFIVGRGNIVIKGTFGYATPPPMIKYAQGRLIAKVHNGGGLSEQNKSESLGDFSFTRFETKGGKTGDLEIDSILGQFRRYFIDGAI